jgi:acetyl esterase/lipase
VPPDWLSVAGCECKAVIDHNPQLSSHEVAQIRACPIKNQGLPMNWTHLIERGRSIRFGKPASRGERDKLLRLSHHAAMTTALIRGAAALVASLMIAPALARPLDYTQLLARPRPAASQRIHYGEGPSQFADLWLPSGKGPHRVVIMIHGGCWRADLPGLDLMAYAADDMRRHGIAVWNIEYRRLGEAGGGYPGTFEDVALAVDWLRKIARTNRLDLTRAVALGHSSGGHLALWAAARPRIPKSSPLYRDHPLPIAGVVSLAGIGDLVSYRTDGPPVCGRPRVIDLLVGAGRRSPWDIYADTSPAQLLPLGVPQAVVSGALDPIVPAAFGRAYAAKAAAAGDVVQELTIKNAGHFELIDPMFSAFGQIRSIIARLQK